MTGSSAWWELNYPIHHGPVATDSRPAGRVLDQINMLAGLGKERKKSANVCNCIEGF